MNSKEIYQLEATAKQVHNELANALVSLNFMRANFDVFPPERIAIMEAEWLRIHQ